MPVTINGTNGVTFNNSSVSSVGSVGDTQTWQNVTVSRTANTVYQNTTGKPILVQITGQQFNNTVQVFCDAAASPTTLIGQLSDPSVAAGSRPWSFSFIVPNNFYYKCTLGAVVWAELR
jgi:hypothetical protein